MKSFYFELQFSMGREKQSYRMPSYSVSRDYAMNAIASGKYSAVEIFRITTDDIGITSIDTLLTFKEG